jgi:hypothetical protein
MDEKGMRCVRVRSGRTYKNPAFPDRTAPDRQHQATARAAPGRLMDAMLFEHTIAGMSGRW